MSRFSKGKDNNDNQPAQQTECVAYGCWLFPVRGFSQGGPLALCAFHSPDGKGKTWDGITARMKLNRGIVDHYYQHLRCKTPVDQEMKILAGGADPGLVVNNSGSRWNKRDDENWAEYNNRFWGELQLLIMANRTSNTESKVA